ncbi:MAG: hypothetical protein IIA60_11375, partial [Candidatus Marinimicrobia bacterium]|nr:hypothetical protein [Candidatus Neomarinimicrobiota bacterium]
MKTRKRLQITVLLALGTVLFIAGCELTNSPPTIRIEVGAETILTGENRVFSAIVEDPDE